MLHPKLEEVKAVFERALSELGYVYASDPVVARLSPELAGETMAWRRDNVVAHVEEDWEGAALNISVGGCGVLIWVDANDRMEVEGIACGDEVRGLADTVKAARQIAEDAKALAELLEKVAELCGNCDWLKSTFRL